MTVVLCSTGALFSSVCFEPPLNTMCDPTFSKKNIKKWLSKMTSRPRKSRLKRRSNDAFTDPKNATDASLERTRSSMGASKSSTMNGESSGTGDASDASLVSSNENPRRATSWPFHQPRQVIDLASASNGDSLEQNSKGVRLGHDEQEGTSTRADAFERQFTQALRRKISTKAPESIDSKDDHALVDTSEDENMGPPPLLHRAKVKLMFRFEKNSAISYLKEDEMHQLAFNASPESLVAIVQEACTRVCRKQYADLLRYLLSVGWDLDMNAYMAFGDGRDEFINKDQLGRFRWRCIADLFPTSIDPSKDFEIPIKIKVSVIAEVEPLPLPASIDIWKQHRLGWYEGIGKQSFGEDGAFRNMNTALILEFPNGNASTHHNVLTPERCFSTHPFIMIGDPCQGEVTDVQVTSLSFAGRPAPYQADDMTVRNRVTQYLAGSQHDTSPDRMLPILPPLTYQPLLEQPTAQRSEERLHLAVRLVNRLEADDLRRVKLPANVLIDARGATNALQLKTLVIGGLQDVVAKKPKGYDWGPDSLVSIARLFDPRAERHWWIDIWVMPQSKSLGAYRRLAKKGGAGKNLAAFLDPTMVEEGDRKLWVEAHLLGPKKEDAF
ncbi:hypothetical protein AC578_2425 [Pseudocercospora eumusae]|uniref:Uncharacterized protein n=1 Tax=Pseudocercospora eumusae TaxID=321146 RepID=A0A139HXR2_9PEZI|nr:hypothetical protein AC578_2425 [Pseudocercospora eumusae]